MAQTKKQQAASPRPFITDYGVTKGHCQSKTGAFASAMNNVIRHGVRHVTIEGPNGALCRLRRSGNGFFGILIEPTGGKPQLVPGTSQVPLKRVK